jgi:hypothetical protein
MELHGVFLDFELPWWNEAVKDPKKRLPETMAYLDEHFEGEEHQQRLELINRGLRWGREELLSITRRYLLRPPLLLLLLCDRTQGPSFLCAVLSVLHENPVENVKLFHDESSGKWGKYIYENPSERPEEEQVFYDLLTENDGIISDLIHFWRQFCLNWSNLTDDLQRLSQTIPDSNGGDKGAPLLIFKTNHPVL